MEINLEVSQRPDDVEKRLAAAVAPGRLVSNTSRGWPMPDLNVELQGRLQAGPSSKSIGTCPRFAEQADPGQAQS